MRGMRVTKRIGTILLAVVMAVISPVGYISTYGAADVQSSGSSEFIGSERQFKLVGSIFQAEAAAVLAAESEHALVYVQDSTLSSFQQFMPEGTVENASAAAIAQEFEKMYAFASTPGLSTFYGLPYDYDGNGKIILFLSDVANDGKESGGTVGGYVSGLFNTADFTTSTSNNSADMLYLDIAPNQGFGKLISDPEGFYYTVMHEYAHLLSYSCVYSNRQAGYQTNPKDVFVEEAFAELAAYLYGGKFSSGKLTSLFTGQFMPDNSFIDWQYGDITFMNASYGAGVMMALAYYNHGGSIHEFLMDTRFGADDSFIAWGDHYVGVQQPTLSYDNFNTLFKQFALDTYVSDPSKIGPHIDNADLDSWDRIDLYNQSVIEPNEDFYFSYRRAPYMPNYFVLARMGRQLGINENVIKITLKDVDAKSRFYVVYPDKPFSSFTEAEGRKYTELIPGQEMTVPVGQGNEFAIIAVNYNYSGTDALVNYTPAVDTTFPHQDMNIPKVNNLKAVHDKSYVVLSWDPIAEVPEGMTISGYQVYNGDKLLTTVSETKTTYNHSYSQLVEGQSYEYTVKALVTVVNQAARIPGEGVSVGFTLLPIFVRQPENFGTQVSSTNTASVKLTWEKVLAVYDTESRQPAPTNYEIYRDDELLYTAGSSTVSYTDRSVEWGESHIYKLRSKFTSGSTTVYSEFTLPLTVKVEKVTVPTDPDPEPEPEPTEPSELPKPGKSQFSYSLTAKTYTGLSQGLNVAARTGVGKVAAVYYTGTSGTKYSKSKYKPVNAGSYTVTIDAGKGTKYKEVKGLSLGTFVIRRASLSGLSFEAIGSRTWTGGQVRPVPARFKFRNKTYAVSGRVSLSYGTNRSIGKGTVKITGKGNFTGIKTLTFKIIPKRGVIRGITVSRRKMRVIWSRASSAQRITGYQLRYKLRGSSRFIYKLISPSRYNLILSRLLRGRRYQVQLRSFKIVSGVRYYGVWSPIKTSGIIK